MNTGDHIFRVGLHGTLISAAFTFVGASLGWGTALIPLLFSLGVMGMGVVLSAYLDRKRRRTAAAIKQARSSQRLPRFEDAAALLKNLRCKG
jgi:hypothetical protein